MTEPHSERTGAPQDPWSPNIKEENTNPITEKDIDLINGDCVQQTEDKRSNNELNQIESNIFVLFSSA